MGKDLVLAGGGHAHMVTLANLKHFTEKGHRVTVVGPSPYHYYSGMGPGMLGGTYKPEEIRFATRHVVENAGAVFVEDMVDTVDPDQKSLLLTSGKTLHYDVLSFNVGSHVPELVVSENRGDIFSVKPIEKLMEARQRIRELAWDRDITVDVIGGGPAAAEVAGNVRQLTRDLSRNKVTIRIFCSGAFMDRFASVIRKKTADSLSQRGIKILEHSRVKEVKTGEITLDSGQVFTSDFIILAVGVKPSTVFERSGLPTGPDGGLLVNKYLQSTAHPEIFGGGDCIYFEDRPLDKVGVYAVRENPVLYNNLMASLDGTELQSFDPGGDYLLIFNLGEGTGVLKKRWLTFGGKTAFFLKDIIDRRFMKKFQSIE